jgi:hypothetical protein
VQREDLAGNGVYAHDRNNHCFVHFSGIFWGRSFGLGTSPGGTDDANDSGTGICNYVSFFVCEDGIVYGCATEEGSDGLLETE